MREGMFEEKKPLCHGESTFIGRGIGKMGEDEIHGEVRWGLQSRKKSDRSKERYTNFDEGRD